MALIEKIEKAIIEINPARFQKLGDAMLKIVYPNAQMFVSEGSQFGKEKTIAGTPDTYIETENESIFVEYSTNVSDKIGKLIDDIDKSVKAYKALKSTKSPKILLITNFKLNLNDQSKLRQYATAKNFSCTIIDGQILAQELNTNHRELIAAYLELPIDTGQIVSKPIFIKEYSNGIGEFACPLDNEFMFRAEELAEILSLMAHVDFVIITGHAGVGKTKIGLEAGELFCKQNPGYVLKCISDKSESLLNDLNLNISKRQKTILFIDDANRIEHFKQIVAFHNSFDAGHLKLLITVRQYAVNEVYPVLPSGMFKKIKIEPMDDQTIRLIVKNVHGINNEQYLDAISSIADGLPRLALMAAKIAVDKQSIESLTNLAALFAEYYKPVISRWKKDKSEKILKSLSILAILGPVKLEDDLVNVLCSLFGISILEFKHSISVLYELEIVNQYNSGFIKIAEQNFGYFIYYTEVIRKNASLFEHIFSLCYPEKASQLKENTISVANLFGVNELRNQISDGLSNIYSNLPNDESKITFLKDYWLLIQDETMAFVASAIFRVETAEAANTSYSLNYEPNQYTFQYSRDKLLDLIAASFDYSISNLSKMIRLALEYVRIKPQLAPQLSWHIDNSFGITIEDINCGLYRQLKLMDILDDGMKQSKPLEIELFWKHVALLLKTEHNYSRPSNRKNTIRICNISIGNCTYVSQLHNVIWEMSHLYYNSESFRKLFCEISFDRRNASKITGLDAKAICMIIEKHTSPKVFADCWMVHEFARRTRGIRSIRSSIEQLSNMYHNKLFDFYLILNWECLNGKQKDIYDDKKHLLKKTEEFNSYLHLKSIRSATSFFKKFLFLWNLDFLNSDNLVPSLCTIICIWLKADFRIGAHLLKLALAHQIEGLDLYPILNTVIASENNYEHIQTIKKIILNNKCKYAFKYILEFYKIVPINYLKKKDCKILLFHLENLSNGIRITIDQSAYVKMDILEKGWYTSFIRLIHEKNENGCKISMKRYSKELQWIDFIDDIELKEKTYLQQSIVTKHFDCERRLLHKILLSRPSFIIDYAKNVVPGRESKLGNIIWSIPNIEDSITFILSRIKRWNLIAEHFPIEWEYVFFGSNICEESITLVSDFIRKFFNESSDKDQAFRIARNFSQPLYEELVLDYIETASPEDFMDIDWTSSSYESAFINTTYGEIQKARWERLLKIVIKSQNLKSLPIIAKIKQRIKQNEESTKEDHERDEIFG